MKESVVRKKSYVFALRMIKNNFQLSNVIPTCLSPCKRKVGIYFPFILLLFAACVENTEQQTITSSYFTPNPDYASYDKHERIDS